MPGSLIGRIGASLPSIVIGLALVTGLWLLPDLTPSDAIPVVGQHSEHARIVEARGTDATGLPLFVVELDDGRTHWTLALAIFTPVAAAYGAIAYGLYLAVAIF